MNFWRLIRRNFFFYRKMQLSVIIATAVGTMVIVGALIVGDSVRFTLKKMTEQRLGNAEFAMATGERFCRMDLAAELTADLKTPVVPVLQLRGMVISAGYQRLAGYQRRVNQAQIIGVDDRFGRLSGAGTLFSSLGPEEAVINQKLARSLELQPGDEILIRLEKPNLLADMAFTSGQEFSITIRAKVKAIAGTGQSGNFNLKNSQLTPDNLFLSIQSLAAAIERKNRANLFLLDGNPSKELTLDRLNQALAKHWKLADAGYTLRERTDFQDYELRSERLFIDSFIAKAALGIDSGAHGVFGYFVNSISKEGKSTPYSIVASSTPMAERPFALADDEIIVNDWLAADLQLHLGDFIDLKYYIIGPMRALKEKSARFRVRAVVPIGGVGADPDLMPDFPGLAEVDNCRDWDPGIPIQLQRIRPKDEVYWKSYRGTPKAFVTLSAAQKMWGNQFGNFTAIRYPGGLAGARSERFQILTAALANTLTPKRLGFEFQAVRGEGIRAVSGAIDFGQLFLGLSFFLILGAIILTGLLFVFNVENRANQTSILRVLGFNPREIWKGWLIEGLILAVIGSVLGVFLGIGYNRLILWALSTVWSSALGGAYGSGAMNFQISLQPLTILMGAAAGVAMAYLAIWIVVRVQMKSQPVALLQGLNSKGSKYWQGHNPKLTFLLGVTSILAALLLIFFGRTASGETATEVFFGAGFLLLSGGLALVSARISGNAAFFGSKTLWLSQNHRKPGDFRLSIREIGLQNSYRRRGRSLAVIGVLAVSVFLIVAIAANRRDLVSNSGQASSGTGGFSLIGETSIPVAQDLNSRAGKRFFGLDTAPGQELQFVQLRVREGDDASCLNLNRVQIPQVLGVNPVDFAKRRAFTFIKTPVGVDPQNPWLVLNQELGEDTIPAVADYTTIVWGLGKSLGDSLIYTDETGRRLKLKLVAGLANSIFQGKVIISEAAFRRHFPSVSGSRLFLVDRITSSEKTDSPAGLSEFLSEAMADFGLELTPAVTRLLEYEAVENTYLSIFLILGGLSIILGSAGLGIVLLRNASERRGEMALLRAVGFDNRTLFRLLLVEHGWLLGIGLVIGLGSGLLAVVPSLSAPGIEFPFGSLALIVLGIMLSGAGWLYLAASIGVRGEPMAGLREE
ncbi:MAG TPA: FtsX-like permease family protein [Bacillota bacterium]|nr:FtsX-like permease family protein [Bacillota bacterium]